MSLTEIVLQLAQGAGYTVIVTLACCATGMAVGLTVAGLRRLNWFGLAPLLDVFTYLFRGIPVLVLLFMVYFGLPGIGLKVPPLLAMMLSLGLIAGAYLAEVFRGALDSIDASEILAAEAMGMSRLQVLVYIELPQMLRFSVPGMVNEFTTVLKYSPFAYTVGVPEITKQAMTLAATTLRGVEVYLAVGLLYFAIYRIFLAGVQFIARRYRVPGMALK
ncbi:MAG: amino acid ABC transporter permease [Gammaproteobacteria bacterium]|nr:amino acid ABC transporter permease [Gammaproteobacteria bacterium]